MTYQRILIPCATLAALWTSPVAAQLRVDVQPALRYQSNAEYSESGERNIRERGWLPGIGAELAYRKDALEAFGTARVFRADIDYDGKLQNGLRHRSETGTRLSQLQFGLRYRFRELTRAVIALEHDEWDRNIKGNGTAFGLHERTRSNRLLLGVEHDWLVRSGGRLSLGTGLVRAERERLNIRFSGLLDDTSMRTKAATGYVIDLRYQPAGASRLQLGSQFDYMKIPRSDAHPVTRNGAPAGAITQPEHVRQGVTLYLKFLF